VDIHFIGFQYLERVGRACGQVVKMVLKISSAQILALPAKVFFGETTFIPFYWQGDLAPFKRQPNPKKSSKP
jgi:cobalt-precorrin-7 (C5)-methyltransferase